MMKLFQRIRSWLGLADAPPQNQTQSPSVSDDRLQKVVDLAVREGEAFQRIRNRYGVRVKYKIAGLDLTMNNEFCGVEILPYHRNGLTCTATIHHGRYDRYGLMPNRTTLFVLRENGGQRYWEVMVKKFFTTETDTWDYCGVKICNGIFRFESVLQLYDELGFLVKDRTPGISDFGNYRIDPDHKAKTEALYRQRTRELVSAVGSAWEKHVKTEAK